MPEASHTTTSRRFGPFELSVESQELRKNGVRLKLSGQAIQVLLILTERPGSIVPREELQQRLWPGNSYGDFEHGLNAAVNRLRETLGDDADNPRYIETLPRRGYRFVGPITPTNPVQITGTVKEEKNEASRNMGRWTLWAVGVGIVGLCALFAVGFHWFRSPLPPRVLRYRQLTTDRQIKGESTGCGFMMATDGPRVFFSEPSSPVQVSSGGGDVVKVSTPFPFACFSIFDISPDKTELLGVSFLQGNGIAPDQPLLVLSIASGMARRLGNLVGHAGAWSPDGQRIVYASGNDYSGNDLYMAAKDGSEARKLIRIENGFVELIRWSPDGKVLRMIVWQKSSRTLWEVSSDGTNLHPLNLFPGEVRSVVDENWTPDGRYFLFTVGRGNTFFMYSGDVWARRETQSVFRRRTAEPIQLTSGAMSFWNPTPSPDGKQIFAIGGQNRGELVRYNLKSRKLELYLSGISAEQLNFSKDGKWVTYVTFPECILWRSRVDGSERMQLNSPPLLAALPRWSPDGKRIAFAGYPPGGPWKIYVVSAEGGKAEVVSQSQNDELDPDWSPDGNSLIFGEILWSAQTHISSVDLRTGRVSTISGSEGLYSPRLSPDGRFIVAIDAPANRKLLLFDQQTQKWSELVSTGIPLIAWPVWSTDSNSVYVFDLGDRRAPVIYRVRIAQRNIERMASFGIPEGLTGYWIGWAGIAPDGSPLTLRDLSIHEIYALEMDWP